MDACALSRFSEVEPHRISENLEIVTVKGLPYELPREMDTKEPKIIAAPGGTGDVFDRYVATAFAKIQAHFPNDKFMIVSRRAIAQKKSALPLADPGVVQSDIFYDALRDSQNGILNIAGRRVEIAGAFLALPPSLHPVAEEFAKKGIIAAVEKPLADPPNLEAMMALARRYPGKLYPVDNMLGCASIRYMIVRNLMQVLGKIEKIEGRIVETPPYNPSRNWLLDPSKSGGGAGMDVLTHILATISALFGSLEGASIKGAVLGRYEANEMPPGGAETYMWLNMRTAGDIEILLDGGAGLNENYEGMNITGTNGTLEIFNGNDTDRISPFIRLTVGGKETVYVFHGGDLGYESTMFDFLLCTRFPELMTDPNNRIAAGFSNRTRLQATYEAVKWVHEAYEWFGYQPEKFVKYEVGNIPKGIPEPVRLSVNREIANYARY